MGNFLDLMICAALVYAIVMFLTGRPEKVTGFMGNADDTYKRFDREKMNRSTLILCVVLLINEAVLLLVKSPAVHLVNLAVSVLSFVVYFLYIFKAAKLK